LGAKSRDERRALDVGTPKLVPTAFARTTHLMRHAREMHDGVDIVEQAAPSRCVMQVF
jgi:hypothetical protein